ncbi:hypothetical protein RND81_04G164900 [Saponaria officinalis]|uniref:XH/XS domain-containing protein n=1 Tax=Saponaria officinalis TaxID=3572 RepID=A0AAW1LEN4_SAPOF
MRHSSEEDTDLSESELEDYADDIYRRLKKERYEVKISTNTFRCPFCRGKRRQEYSYHDLLQHAKSIGKSSRSAKLKEKGDHIALADYLDRYHRPRVSAKLPEKSSSDVLRESGKLSEKSSSHLGYDKNEKFAWPWKGIVANLPVQKQNGRYVGESGSKLRDELAKKGFNPVKVIPLWTHEGHSGFAVVNFNKDFAGFGNAMSFEKSFESEQCGRRAWYTSRSRGDKLYGWMAREVDFSSGVIGKHLRDNSDVKSINEVETEDTRLMESLVSNLTETIKSKDDQVQQMKSKFQETCASLNKAMQEKDTMTQAYNEEMQRIQMQTMKDTRKIFGEHEMFKKQLESERERLERREKDLKKREANYDNEVIELRRRRKMNALASAEQKKADESVLRLMEEQKREKEELLKKIINLQKQLDGKQALELEIEQLRGKSLVLEHMERDAETKRKMEEIDEELKDKEEDLQALEDLAQTLIVKERNSNDELQDARKELITGLSKETRSTRATIGVKFVGALDGKLFEKVAKDKYPSDHVPTKAEELMAICRSHIEDHDWHPFKTVTEHGVPKEVINEDDERLQSLRNDLGEEAWQAMVTAMSELNEYNASGRYPVPELWNLKEGRKATLKEGAEFILNKWKNQKRTRR